MERGVEFAGLAGPALHLRLEALAAGIDRQLGGRFQFFHPHEHLVGGVGDDGFGFLVVLAHHRRDVLRGEHQREAERAAMMAMPATQ